VTNFIITVLVEDRSDFQGLRPEHGLSLLLEIKGEKWLFDAGQSGLVVENARNLGIDLSEMDGIILSHGHYDHTGGLKSVLGETGDIPVYAHPGIFRERFSRNKYGRTKPVGLPFSRDLLEKSGARFSLSAAGREIYPGIYLSGEIPRRTSFERGDPFLVIRDEKRYLADPFIDDQFLTIDCDDGVIMITGCCHAGLINSLMEVRELHPGKRIKAIVGGLHLRAADQTMLAKIIGALEPFAPEEIIAGHCTGPAAESYMASAFGRRFHEMKTGAVFRIGS
jgi:7,8-dihydropterin-6-yl-methyl-4-(beta-D-ribofuranosyl)aminobenzene 5'-phosphate synthase